MLDQDQIKKLRRFHSASKRVVQKLLYQHTHRRNYLLKVGQGGARFNLDGTEDGVILPEEREYAGRLGLIGDS